VSTPYISIDNITHINAELSNFCNAACPMCARFDSNQNLLKDLTNNSHTTLNDIKHKIGEKIISNLRIFRSCGNLGDGTMNPDCAEIYDFIRSKNKKIKLSINTNGGARSEEFYKEMAKIGVDIIFSIDGLEDTNHLYRRNVKWGKLMSNAESFIKSGGHAQWDFLVFKHNQHQVDLAKQLSEKMGFKSFNKKTTTRWNDFDSDGNWIEKTKIKVDGYDLEKPSVEKVLNVNNTRDIKVKDIENPPVEKVLNVNNTKDIKVKDIKKNSTKIVCNSFMKHNVEIFLHANGNVSPCCWLGDLKIHESKNIIKDYNSVNIKYSSLEEILNGQYFKEIWKGIIGQQQDYRLVTCQNVCGKYE